MGLRWDPSTWSGTPSLNEETGRVNVAERGRVNLSERHRLDLDLADFLSRDDAVLHKFYRMVAESERHQAEWNKRAFQAEDDVD